MVIIGGTTVTLWSPVSSSELSDMHSSRVVFRAPAATTTQHPFHHRHHSPKIGPLAMSLCRSLSLMFFSLIAGVLVVSGIIFGTVRAQQSGSVQLFGSAENNSSSSSASSSSQSSEKSVPVISATNSNNYAASIAALTAGQKPAHFSAFSSSSKTDPSKYTGKIAYFNNKQRLLLFCKNAWKNQNSFEKINSDYYCNAI